MTNDASAPEVQTKRPRWLYVALFASLAANLVVLGGAASAFWHHRHGRHEHSLSGFVSRLPADRREPLREFVKGEREKLKPIRVEVRTGWRETNELITAEPFDKEKLKAAMSRMNDAESRMRSTIGEALVETASKMTLEERQALRKWRERRIERGLRKWRRDLDDEDDDRGPPGPPPPGPPPPHE